MHQNIIFIGGIHGVGKGTICLKLADEFNFKHLSASQVLKWSEVSPDMSNKFVKDISDTQNRLIDGLGGLISREEKYLLDGHFCLFDSRGIPQKVSIDTFHKIAPKAITVVITDVIEIVNRLRKRDGKEYDPFLLDKMQNSERRHAIFVAKELDIPFFEIRNSNMDELINFISNK